MKRTSRQLRLQDGLFLCAAIFSLLFLTAVEGNAADPDYPSRPIDYVTFASPGSTQDLIGRLMADIIAKEKILSQPMVVLNKTGSGGAVAFGYVYERKGNPHLVLIVPSASFLLTPMLTKLPYNYKSFVPLCNLAVDGSVLAVRSDSPFKTVDDLFAEAKKKPKELLQGGGSFTAPENMQGRAMQKIKGVQWNFVSFAGGSNEALVNLLSGNVHFILVNPDAVRDHVRSGKVRVLLNCAPTRFSLFQDVPTVKEAGLGEPVGTYRGMVGPPDMPEYAAKKLEAVFKRITENDRFKKYIEDSMMQPAWMPSQEYGKFLDEENSRWKTWASEFDLLKKK